MKRKWSKFPKLSLISNRSCDCGIGARLRLIFTFLREVAAVNCVPIKSETSHSGETTIFFLRHYNKMRQYFLPANEVCDGSVFTPVCHSVHGGGGFPACITGLMTRGICIHEELHQGGLHLGAGGGGRGLGRPSWDTMGYGQRAGSTRPTGMHSCLICV